MSGSGASAANLRESELAAMRRDSSVLLPSDISAAAVRLRAARCIALEPFRVADALSRAVEAWRDKRYARRRDAIARIASEAGYSVVMLDASIGALLKPFSRATLNSLAGQVSSSGRSDRPALVGFIMAGNVAGAGLHEIAIGLIAGASLLIKTASAEPVFFDEFASTLAELDREVAARIAVFNWSRARDDLNSAMAASCDHVVAYGDDATIESFHEMPALIGFGSRVSAAVVAPGALIPARIDAVAEALARDVVLFEQLGCLSPHQVFVVSPSHKAARDFAARMAVELDRLSHSLPPAMIPLRDAAEILRVRESARWRRIAGEPNELFEGARLGWTVVFEPESIGGGISEQPHTVSPRVSPGFRCLYVTDVRDESHFRASLGASSRYVEAIAVAGDEAETRRITAMLNALDISYLSKPGEMQSPPLVWRHGGGAFLELMVPSR